VRPDQIELREKLVSAATNIKGAAMWLKQAQKLMTPEQVEEFDAARMEKVLRQFNYDLSEKIYEVFDK
jgi:hypothetical protein